MALEIVTKEDLQLFRMQLLEDLKQIFRMPDRRPDQLEWLKGAEVKALLKISAGTLQSLRISGTIKAVKVMGTWYYSRQEVDALFVKRPEK